jgi:hypothetical protein
MKDQKNVTLWFSCCTLLLCKRFDANIFSLWCRGGRPGNSNRRWTYFCTLARWRSVDFVPL